MLLFPEAARAQIHSRKPQTPRPTICLLTLESQIRNFLWPINLSLVSLSARQPPQPMSFRPSTLRPVNLLCFRPSVPQPSKASTSPVTIFLRAIRPPDSFAIASFSSSSSSWEWMPARYGVPSSQDLIISTSMGKLPRNLTPMSWHIFSAPPVEGWKILVSVLHFGHTNPAMFSTTPSTGRPTFLQKFISFLTSRRDTSCGVVTMTAPEGLASERY
mmetsp:Transcript_49241/g.76892  ORF Transcript_49241/g.76892 Transcript_49241/m.76892 type:complete len:216 (-) Transcript_49241:592-1239(-)